MLDSPTPQKPSFHQLLRQAFSDSMDIANALNNTGLPWSENTYQLNYNPNQSEYIINAPDWGKCLFATRLTGNPYIKEVPVGIGDRNNEHYGTILQMFYGVWGGILPYEESPEQLIFWRTGAYNSEQMVSVMPQPQQAWVYLLRYEVGYSGTGQSLGDALQLPEHQELSRLRSAASLLPYAEWGSDDAMNNAKRQALMMGFQYQLQRKEDLFRKYITSLNSPRPVFLDNWNS